MPRNKKKIPKKRTVSKNSRAIQRKNNNDANQKKSTSKTPSSNDSIAKSKKLAEKMQSAKANRTRKPNRSSTSNDEPRICGNGKPMPSLADLEKMFEDSDDDEESKKNPTSKEPIRMPTPTETISTPERSPIPLEKLTSPSTIQKIANKMMEIITNLPDSTMEIVEGPPPPIIPPKKHKKPEVPYIVGCKDLPQVPHKPSVNFCKGDDYGIKNNGGDNDSEHPSKRAKRMPAVNLSKSRFNAKSDEIAAWLKDCDKAEQSNSSSDSNKTIEYTLSGRPRSFSPQPSTSRDDVTISQNDKKFCESFINDSKTSTEHFEHDNTLNETIVIPDEIDNNQIENKNITEITLNSTMDTPREPILIDDEVDSQYTINRGTTMSTDDCVEIINGKKETNSKNTSDNSNVIDLDDYYRFTDTDFVCDIPEVIDVDDVIAENKAIIGKYCKVEKLNSVTNVDSKVISSLSNETNQPGATSNREINTPNNLECTLVSPVNERQTGQSSPDVRRKQIKSIVKNFFEKPSHKSNSMLNKIISKYGAMSYRLLDDLTKWSRSFAVPTARNNTNMVNTPLTETPERHDNDVIIIAENSSTQQTDLHNINMHYPTTSSSVNNRVTSTVPIPVRHTVQLPPGQRSSSVNNRVTSTVPIPVRHTVQLPPGQRRNNGIETINRENRNQLFNSRQEFPYENDVQLTSPYDIQLTRPIDTATVMQNVLCNRSRQTAVVSSPRVVVPRPQVNCHKKSKRECPICMDSLANIPVASTICGHVFCMQCIKAAIMSNGKRCPTCRKPLKGMGYHPLFL